MGIYNPLYNEETGWTPLDQLEPWQQALLNPGARNPGMSMPGYDQNLMSMLGSQNAGVNPGAGTGGSMMSPDPYTWTGPQNSGAGNAAFNNIFNSGTTPRPSQATPVIGSPQLATNMGMTGAENVGGMGMYTGSNGPLDTTRFTPVQGQQQNGPPPGSIPTGDPNTWITPWGSTYTTPGAVNNQSSADYDAYRQRAFGNIMGPQGRGPQSNPYAELTDVLRQVPGSINAQTFQGYLGSLQGQQTGPYSPQQTAPLPSQGGNSQRPGQQGPGGGGMTPARGGMRDPAADAASYAAAQEWNVSSGNAARLQQQYEQDQARMQAWQQADPQGYALYMSTLQNTQRPGQQSPVIGSPGQIMGPRPYSNQGNYVYDPVRQRLDMMNMEWAQNPNWYPGATGWNGIPISQYQPIGYRAGYDPNSTPSGGYGPEFQTPTQSSISMGPGAAAFAPGGTYGGQDQMQVDPAMPFGNQRGTLSPDVAAYYGLDSRQNGQPDYQRAAQQFSSDPATQQAYLRDMFGGGQQQQNPYQNSQPDFRAATFGGGPLFPASVGGSGNTNIPNTTNPSTSQYSQPQAGWGGATNRRSGFGGMSLFGNQFGSGGSTGFGGTQPSQYRGAGSYGRPASYGQSQRPY